MRVRAVFDLVSVPRAVATGSGSPSAYNVPLDPVATAPGTEALLNQSQNLRDTG